MVVGGKERLDKILVLRNLAPTRQKAQALIAAGTVTVNGNRVDKAGSLINLESDVAVQGDPCPYVSRGGLKLAAGLDFFKIDPSGMICADIGASTGGFTDCLLQYGAKRVYAIDVGYGQLDWKLRNDPRVVVMERTNARWLQQDDIAAALDLAVIDAAFISLRLLLTPVLQFFPKDVSILALIKPQFEVGRGKVGKGGVVRDPVLHHETIETVLACAAGLGLECMGVAPSPILGPKGNQEFLVHLTSSVSGDGNTRKEGSEAGKNHFLDRLLEPSIDTTDG